MNDPYVPNVAAAGIGIKAKRSWFWRVDGFYVAAAGIGIKAKLRRLRSGRSYTT